MILRDAEEILRSLNTFIFHPGAEKYARLFHKYMKNRQSGFTLVEIVISIVIVAIAFYTLIIVLGNVTIMNVGNQQALKAAFLVERVMEEFTVEGKDWNNDYVSRETESFGGDFTNFSNKVDVYYVDLNDLNGCAIVPPTDYKRVEVIVTGEALDVPIKLVTLKVKYIQ